MGKATSLDFFFKKIKSELGLGKSLLLGFVISGSGSAMIGALHLIAIQISIEKSWQSAILFSTGCGVIEGIFAGYVSLFIHWISKKKNALLTMEWLLLILFLALTIACFWIALSVPKDVQAVITPSLIFPTFILGMGIRIIYPSMIPFWLTWNTILITREIRFRMIPFMIGVGLATVTIHYIYIFAGHLFIDFLKNKSQEMLWLIGGILLLTVFFQIKRIKSYKMKNAS